nr:MULTISPECIES: helix-turn-helix domain-containing protein [unclassified Bradyrhizobium]
MAVCGSARCAARSRRSPSMLTAQLRELERDGLVARRVLAEKPLQVEYELTDSAWSLTPAFRELLAWSKTFGPRRNSAAS